MRYCMKCAEPKPLVPINIKQMVTINMIFIITIELTRILKVF